MWPGTRRTRCARRSGVPRRELARCPWRSAGSASFPTSSGRASLELLQHSVEREFAPLGFPTEARAFQPHLTLGRAAREAGPRDLAGLEGALAGLHFQETALVDSVDLMQSTLQSGGAVYQVRHSERLL